MELRFAFTNVFVALSFKLSMLGFLGGLLPWLCLGLGFFNVIFYVVNKDYK